MSQTSAAGPSSYRVRIADVTDGGDRVPDLSPREASERWLNKLRVERSESTVSSYHYRLKHFIEFCESEGIVTIDELTGWDIESYETSRREQGLEPISLNNELGTLQNFLEYCARIELVDEDLPEKVDPPDVPKSEQVNKTRLETHRAQALLNYYDAHPDERASRAHVLLAVTWYTGARLGAIRGLDVDDFYPDEECVSFVHRPDKGTPLKNGIDGERVVGLPEDVCELVSEYILDNRLEQFDEYGRRSLLTSQMAGRPSKNGVRGWMYLATVPCLHTDCPHGNDPETCDYTEYNSASQCPSSRSPHQVRTGSITWQLNKGLPPERVSERVNTSIETLLRHYDQPGKMEEMRERRAEFIDRLDFEDDGGIDE